MRDLEEEVCRLRCKGEEDKGRHRDGSRIYMRSNVVINGVEGVEEVVAPTDTSSTSVSKGGVLSEDSGEGSTTGPTRSRGTPFRSCSPMGLAYWASASFYHCRYWSLGRADLGPPSSYSWPQAAWDASQWWTTTTWRSPISTGRSYKPSGGGEKSE